MKCELCDAEEPIPFRCRYCSGLFCSNHRLPPNHKCALLHEFIDRPIKDREFIQRVQGQAGSPTERIYASLKNTLILRFSKLEIVHLAIGTALVTAVGMSLNNYNFSWSFLAIFISAFIVHEFGHKFLAQMYNAWAEFRVIFFGAAMTAISIFLPLKFIAPGAVFIGGPLSEGRHGRVALIGPLTNLAMGAGFIVTYYLAPGLSEGLSSTMRIGAFFNGWIAFFNLIPFMGLDGSKILSWNKVVWILTMAAAIGLFISGGALEAFGRFF